jgi:hypothetical protein
MRKFPSLFLASTLFISTLATPLLADDWHRHGDHEFREHGFDHWRGGRWYNGFHDGHGGWWWVVDGLWYYYPAPVYPYPDPYTPPNVIVQAAPSTQAAYYYCANPPGYYPSVPQCAVAWQRVITAPAAQAQQPVPAPQVAAPTNQHDIDLQQLNAYAAQLQAIDPSDKHARARLKDLDKHVEAFRQSLYKKNYNAMDILRDAEDLKHRIADQKAKLSTHAGGAIPAPIATSAPMAMPAPAFATTPSASPTPMVAPAPTTPPPGTTVTFPPQ